MPDVYIEIVYGEQNPIQGETPVSWSVWSDFAGGSPTIVGDPDWGKLQLVVGEIAVSDVIDNGASYTYTYTYEENRYGTGQDAASFQIRGSDILFNQDDELPEWEDFIPGMTRTWRYVQIRVEHEAG